MNFNFGEWHSSGWGDLCGVREENGQPILFLGPKGWLFSLEHGMPWYRLLGDEVQFVMANGTASYHFQNPRVFKSRELVFAGTGIPEINMHGQIPQDTYEYLYRSYMTRSFERIYLCSFEIEKFWILQILKELIAEGQVHMEVDAAFTPCQSLLDHLELQPIPSLFDREALFKSLSHSCLRGNRGSQDLFLAEQEMANVWRVPLFAFPETTSIFVMQRSPEDFRLMQALPFAVITENKEKERFSLFIVDTVEGAVNRVCQRKNFADLLPFLSQKISQDMLQLKELRNGDVNIGKLCSMQAWSIQARHSNRAEVIGDIEKLQTRLRSRALDERYKEDPDLQNLIRKHCVVKPVSVQLELNGV